jgi:hypothetical protein
VVCSDSDSESQVAECADVTVGVSFSSAIGIGMEWNGLPLAADNNQTLGARRFFLQIASNNNFRLGHYTTRSLFHFISFFTEALLPFAQRPTRTRQPAAASIVYRS